MKTLLILSTILFLNFSQKREINTEKIKWISWNSLDYKMKNSPKKIYVFIYTHNCRWCKKMEISIFKNHEIIEKLNKDYYCVKLYSSTKKAIKFNGKIYKNIYSTNKNKRKIHGLVEYLLDGYYRFPTSLILSENYKILSEKRGSSNIENFKKMINYF